VVTIALIVVNVLIFLYSQALGRGFELFVFKYGFVPGLFFGATGLEAQSPYIAFLMDQGWHLSGASWLTPFSSMFLHGGWLHLITNMLVLWIYGNNIEDYFGPVKFTIFYLVSGLTAVGLFSLPNLDSAVPLVGASGAIAGVMGAYLVLHPRARVTCLLFFFFIQFVVLPAKVVLGVWFAYQILAILLGSPGNTAWLAHVGGFVFGWVLLRLLVRFRGKGTTPGGGQRVYKVQW
jgi:membrane associated rhomboid family serine protease